MGIFDRPHKLDRQVASFSMNQKKIVCPFCGHDKFEYREILLNTPGMTFLGFDWANRSASVLICTDCSRIEWFFNQPNFM